MNWLFGGLICLVIIVGILYYLSGLGHDAASLAGVSLPDDKLGWMDDKPFTDADRARVGEITGQGFDSNLGVIRNIQSRGRSSLTRRDFELLRQDRRRAKAAYPDISADDLFTGTWVQVDLSSRVPDSFCTSGNSNGTQGSDGKWYLDGGCYVSVVRSDYAKRADAPTTKRVLAELKDGARQKRLKSMNRWGYMTAWSGTGGSASVNCYPDPLPSSEEADDTHIAGMCVVILDDKTKYTFPFVAADWLERPGDLAKFAESKGAQAVTYVEPERKPWEMKDGLLARGQTGEPGRLYWSHFNSDKDDYDNEDIGPDTPESWVLEQPFGIAYLPAPDNGERRSVPGKPWYLVASYYGFPSQVSGGWEEAECKEAMRKLQTGHSWGMMGQDQEELNRGNLKEGRCTQVTPTDGVMVLKDRAIPVQPVVKREEANRCVQGGTLMPGQSCTF